MTSALAPAVHPETELASPGPVTPSGRLVGIDIARAVALLGMFTQHVTVDGDDEFSTGWVSFVFRESAGRASVLFFVLSGVSLSIIAARGSASATPGALYRRGLLLLVGGLLVTASIWPASILQHYGLAFLGAPLLLRLGRRGLLAVTGLGLVGGPVALLVVRNWTDDLLGPIEGESGRWLVGSLWDILVSGIYPMILWIGFFTLGVLIGRLDLTDRRSLLRLAGLALVVVFVVGSAAAAATDRYGVADQYGPGPGFEDKVFEDTGFEDAGFEDPAGFDEFEDKGFEDKGFDDKAFEDKAFDGFEDFEVPDVPFDARALLDVTGHSGGMGWTLQTGSLAVSALALALLLPAGVTRLLAPLAWMGSMSLTAYLVHIVLVTDVAGPHLEESDWSILTRELFFAGLLVAMIAICAVFHRLLGVGPLEWLLKQFTRPGRGSAPSTTG